MGASARRSKSTNHIRYLQSIGGDSRHLLMTVSVENIGPEVHGRVSEILQIRKPLSRWVPPLAFIALLHPGLETVVLDRPAKMGATLSILSIVSFSPLDNALFAKGGTHQIPR